MRQVDQERFQQPYPTTEDGHPICDLGAAVGSRVESLRELLADVRRDLEPDPGRLGIGWWKVRDESGDQLRRRLVVSDYLIAALEGVDAGLLDMTLHRLELLDLYKRSGEFLRDGLDRDAQGRPRLRVPQRRCPADDLVGALVDVHLAGMLRCAASVLDCLAGATAIVGSLRVKVLETGWGQVKDKLAAIRDQRKGVREPRADLKAAVIEGVRSAGPADWDRWLLSYRNMLVHRGLRLKLTEVQVEESAILDLDGRGFLTPRPSPRLVRDPALTDVEAFAMSPEIPPVLEEDGRVTLEGSMASVRTAVEIVAVALRSLWARRREKPDLLQQPLEAQWPIVRRTEQRAFAGYAPGTSPYSPDWFHMPPQFVDRMKAAALVDPLSTLWTDEEEK